MNIKFVTTDPDFSQTVNSLLVQAVYVLALLAFISGCATESGRQGRSISENGQPLTFQINRAIVSKEPASFLERTEIALTGFDLNQAAGQPGYVYKGPVKETPIYKKFTPKQSESYLIVEFSISGVLRTPLELSKKDVQLIDGKGVVHETLGVYTAKDDTWHPFNSMTLIANRADNEKWIFIISDNAVGGATIRFQERQYPLTISK